MSKWLAVGKFFGELSDGDPRGGPRGPWLACRKNIRGLCEGDFVVSTETTSRRNLKFTLDVSGDSSNSSQEVQPPRYASR